jgi:hypothetical protein
LRCGRTIKTDSKFYWGTSQLQQKTAKNYLNNSSAESLDGVIIAVYKQQLLMQLNNSEIKQKISVLIFFINPNSDCTSIIVSTAIKPIDMRMTIAAEFCYSQCSCRQQDVKLINFW